MSVNEPTPSAGPGRPISRRRDPFQNLRAIRGPNTKVRWWERARASMILLAIVVALGVLVAVGIGMLLFLATVGLEAISG